MIIVRGVLCYVIYTATGTSVLHKKDSNHLVSYSDHDFRAKQQTERRGRCDNAHFFTQHCPSLTYHYQASTMATPSASASKAVSSTSQATRHTQKVATKVNLPHSPSYSASRLFFSLTTNTSPSRITTAFSFSFFPRSHSRISIVLY